MFIGRTNEIKTLSYLQTSGKAEFVAIWGRRRIGKTYLVNSFFKDKAPYFFNVTGQKKGNKKRQLEIFRLEIERLFFAKARIPDFPSWREALNQLTACLASIETHNPSSVVVFLDELPWLSTPKSDLLGALDHAWKYTT